MSRSGGPSNVRPGLQKQPFCWPPGSLIEATPGSSLLDVDQDEVKSRFKECGLLLFSGFEVTPSSFCEFSERYGCSFGQIGGSLRASANQDGSLFEVTEGTGELEFHTELGHSPCRPDIVWFWCLEPADEGGETRLLDGTKVIAELPVEVAELFEKTRLKYSHCMPEVMWKGFFGANTKQACEAYLESASGVQEICFDSSNTLTFRYLVPAFAHCRFRPSQAWANSLAILSQKNHHVESTRPVTFSSFSDGAAASFYMKVAFEDDRAISNETLAQIRTLAESISLERKLERGEVLMVDNTVYQHSRRAFRGRRSVLSRFARANFE